MLIAFCSLCWREGRGHLESACGVVAPPTCHSGGVSDGPKRSGRYARILSVDSTSHGRKRLRCCDNETLMDYQSDMIDDLDINRWKTHRRPPSSRPERINIPPIPAGPEFKYLQASRDSALVPESIYSTRLSLTCKYTKQRNPPPTHPISSQHSRSHAPYPARSTLLSHAILKLLEGYRRVGLYSIVRGVARL